MDVQTILNRVVEWHRESQYEPIVQLLEILIETSNGSTKELEHTIMATKETTTQQQTKASLYTYFGDALYKLKYFRRALRAYEQALSYNDSGSRRASKRCKTISAINNSCDISKINSNTINTNENELKHRMHLCHIELHELKEARAVLERVPPTERNVKILSSLADIYQQDKNLSRAKEMYLRILLQDPLRLDIIVKIGKLGGCDEKTILEMVQDEVLRTFPWYSTWITAQCSLHSPDSKKAIRHFETLTTRFERRASILTNLAEAYYHDGNFREAVRIFQIAYNSDPLTLTGYGSYAACLHKESSKRTLEELAVSMSLKCSVEGEYFYEPWLALAHYYASNDKKEPKALLFAQKAYKLNRYAIETLILLACLCLEKKNSSKAIPYIMTAQVHAPYRYEVQRILCDSFLANNKKVAAVNYAKSALTSLGDSARSNYLNADIILKCQPARKKNWARNHLEKAIKQDPTYLPATFAYADLMMDEKKFDKAIEVLKYALPHHSTHNELHKYLFNCYSEMKDNDKALYHQNLALDHTTSTRSNHESLHRGSQDNAVTQEDVDTLLGLEADELVDQGDSEVDDVNLDA